MDGRWKADRRGEGRWKADRRKADRRVGKLKERMLTDEGLTKQTAE